MSGPALAVAGLSARMGVELAARSGMRAVALDVFGDVDTCAAASGWRSIGDAGTLRIDRVRLLAALDALAREGEVAGWIAGSGFEGRIDLLEEGASRLPLFGTALSDIRLVRTPQHFFATLDALRLPHPAVRFDPPPAASGWLAKQADSAGGWGVRRASSSAPAARAYWQQERPGRPMSATFVANGEEAVLLGLNEQCMLPIGDHPFVFGGVIGPVSVSPALRRDVSAAVRALARHCRLRGLASLDFLADGDEIELLEINPRLVASAGLYAEADPLRLHWRACVDGALPAATAPSDRVDGWHIVFARRAMHLGERAAALIGRWPDAQDRPRAGTRLRAGDPLCSLRARAATVEDVRAELAQSSLRLLDALEQLS